MAAVDLAVGEVEDVADDSANRGTHGVQDAKRLAGEVMIRTSVRRRARGQGPEMGSPPVKSLQV